MTISSASTRLLSLDKNYFSTSNVDIALKFSIIIVVLLISFTVSVSDASEFEGKYQVGNTTCTVKPTKMAFELRWAKGKGVMLFFFDRQTDDGKLIYISDDKNGDNDRFEFENGKLMSGKFVRSDGKVFQVRKISK